MWSICSSGQNDHRSCHVPLKSDLSLSHSFNASPALATRFHADAEVDATVFGRVSVALQHALLERHGAANGINNAGKLGE